MRTGRRGSLWRQLSSLMGLLFLAALLGIIGAFLYAKDAKAGAEASEIIAAVLAIAALAPPLVRRWQQASQRVVPKTDELESAMGILAGAVEEQWRQEAIIRSLGDPDPIPVVWRLTEHEDLMDHPQLIASTPLAFSEQSDRISELVQAFRGLRRRRLVILGGPGTGKTTLAVQLVLELLRSRVEGEPIPVLLTVGNWNTADHERLQDWLAMKLDQDYPALRAEDSRVSVSQSLAARAHILPVLDGLDELPDAARAKVIAALNASLGVDDQLILTSRTSEYAAAVDKEGTVLRSAAVIEPEALSPDTAVSYLENCLPRQADSAWAAIFLDMRKGRAKALAEVTSTPLGIWLLRTVYITNRRSPTPLRRKHLRDPSVLKRHLFSELIPALVWSRTPTSNPAEIYRPRHTWDPKDISRWLGFHAWRLREINSKLASENDSLDPVRDFTWWHLGGLNLSTFMIGPFAIVAGLFNGLIFAMSDAIALGPSGLKRNLLAVVVIGLGTGLSQGIIFWVLAHTTWPYEKPGYADLHIRRRRRSGKGAARTGGPLRRLTSPLGMALFVAFTITGVGATKNGAVSLGAGLVAGLVVWLCAWLFKWAESPSVTDRAVTPMSSWRADRTLIVLRISLTMLVFGLAFSFGYLLQNVGQRNLLLLTLLSVLGGASIGFFFGVVMGNHHAWLLFVIARWWIALLGHWFPFRLMTFLDDCHRLGLLRAVGPTYQYRHAELQDYLAANFSKNYLRVDPRSEIRAGSQ